MDYKFFLNDLEVDEPVGWDQFELSIKRDSVYHGMQFEASTNALTFYGEGANYLKEQKDLDTVSAFVILRVEETCGDTYTEVFSGRLNFGKYKDSCGNSCMVTIPIEEQGCKVTFKNRFDQKVDIDSLFAMNKTTILPDYSQLGQEITLIAKALQASIDGNVSNDGYIHDSDSVSIIGGSTVYVRPDYEVERYNNIETGQLIGVNNCVGSNGFSGSCPGPITPQLLLEDNIDCFDGNFDYTSRYKGTLNLGSGASLFLIKHKIFKWDATGTIFGDHILIQETTIFDGLPSPPAGPQTIPFDSTLTGTTTIAAGEGFYSVIEVGVSNGTVHLNIDIDPETLITIDAIKICPNTDTQYYMVHECLSRVVEAITNRCIRVKSSYYGRIDSQPFAFDNDGCGSLRFLTSGLKIRRAPDAKFFASAKDLISGLNAIDNIGFSISPDPVLPNKFVLNVEKVDDFYKDQQIFSVDAIALASNEIQESMYYSKINVGYEKWEIENINGLNEINSNREYRTNIETINNTLDIKSKLVAGSYPIEITRQQSFADSGAEDTTYDNEIFIICVQRNAYDFTVEQGLINNPVNIFDPNTVYNYRISPLRNLMRWFKSIINSYSVVWSSSNRTFFNSGTGNFLAAGNLNSSFCKLENSMNIDENGDLWAGNFASSDDYTPLWKNETIAFDYPLSFADYNSIKSNPYGYIAYTCGLETIQQKAFIDEIKFKPSSGMANFTLIKKWQQ